MSQESKSLSNRQAIICESRRFPSISLQSFSLSYAASSLLWNLFARWKLRSCKRLRFNLKHVWDRGGFRSFVFVLCDDSLQQINICCFVKLKEQTQTIAGEMLNVQFNLIILGLTLHNLVILSFDVFKIYCNVIISSTFNKHFKNNLGNQNVIIKKKIKLWIC